MPGDLFEDGLQFLRLLLVGAEGKFELFLVGLLALFLFQLLLFEQLQNLVLQAVYVVLILVADLLESADLVPLLGLRLLSLHGLAHTVGDGGLVERLVRQDRHFNFVAHAHQKEAALSAVDGHLPDNLVETLCVQVFPNRANARLTGLALLQLLVELLLEDAHVQSRRRDRANILEPELAVLFILVRGQNRVQVVLGLRGVGGRQTACARLGGGLVRPAASAFAQGLAHEDGRLVLDE